MLYDMLSNHGRNFNKIFVAFFFLFFTRMVPPDPFIGFQSCKTDFLSLGLRLSPFSSQAGAVEASLVFTHNVELDTKENFAPDAGVDLAS